MDNPNLTLSDVSLIEALPSESIMNILWKIKDLNALFEMCSTSKAIREVCNDNYFWKVKYRKDFDLSCLSGLSGKTTIPGGVNWKELYKRRLLSKKNSPISAGYMHYAIIDDQGILYTAGRNYDGQLGDGTVKSRSELTPVKIFDKKVISVSCGSSFTIAITEDGKTYMWGEKPFYGGIENQEEEEDEEDSGIYSTFPILIDELKNHKAFKVSCGEFGWGVILDDGSIYYTIQAEYFSYGLLTGFVSLRNRVIDLSVHSHGVAMVTENGEVYYFGDSFVYGVVGIQGKGVSYGEPHSLAKYSIHPVHVPIQENIMQVSLGRLFIIALSVKGNVFTWGDNTINRLGIDRKTRGESSNLTYQKPIKLERLSKISYIYSKGALSSAVTEDGRVYIWGRHKVLNDIALQLGGRAKEEGISGDMLTKRAELPIEIDIGYRVNYLAFTYTLIIEITEDGMANYMGTDRY